jgi:hypothetical protein
LASDHDKECAVKKQNKLSTDWEQLFMQYKNQAGDLVACFINKQSKKRVYFDMKLNRVLSKREAFRYTIDLTSQFPIHQ